MAILPKMPNGSRVQQVVQVNFGGLHAGENCRDGEWKKMMNMSVADLPVIRTRSRRMIAPWTADNAVAALVNDKEQMIWVDSTGAVWQAGLQYGEKIKLADAGTVPSAPTATTKLVRFGNRAMVLPDGMLLNINYRILGRIEEETPMPELQKGDAYIWPNDRIYVWNGEKFEDKGEVAIPVQRTVTAPGLIIEDGTLFGEPAEANTLAIGTEDLSKLFRVGDAVEISGCSQIKSNNKIPVVREIDGNKLRFTPNTFTLPEGETAYVEVQHTEMGKVIRPTVQRRWPELDFCFEHGNRLWGGKDKTIFCSKLGDPLSWYVLGDGLSTDAWQLETQSDGKLTGGISYSGYPTFFKPGCRIMIYGSNASNFSTREIAMPGASEELQGLTQIAGGRLIYQAGDEMMIYASEGYPQSQRDTVGRTSEDGDGLAASTGKEYIGLIDANGQDALCCWDAERRAWGVEDVYDDDHNIREIVASGDKAFLVRIGGRIEQLRGEAILGWSREEDFDSLLETGDMTGNAAAHKWITRVLIRVKLETGARLDIDVSHDGGAWLQTGIIDNAGGTMDSWYFPVRPNRCDNFRIRFRGRGGWQLQSMAVERRVGTALH